MNWTKPTAVRCRNLWAAAVLVVISVFTGGCDRGPQGAKATDPIRIGQLASLTGRQASLGQYAHAGAVAAVKELNAAGGVLGRQLELITEDLRSNSGEAATSVRKLISRDAVVAIVSSGTSGQALEAGPFCQQQGIPMVCDGATAQEVTAMGDAIFRVCFTDPFQGTVMARFALETLKIQRVGLLVDASSHYSVGLAEFFKQRFLADGGTIVGEQKYSGGDRDFRPQLTALKAAQPEALFIPGLYAETGLILPQARELGIMGSMLGGDGWEAPELLQLADKSAEGGYFPVHFSTATPTPRVREWMKRVAAEFGREPNGITALGYDAVMLLADAIRRAGTTDPAALRSALAATKDFDALTGRITLDAQRNAKKPAVIVKIEAGAFKFLQTVEP